jgi:hypothetical protein
MVPTGEAFVKQKTSRLNVSLLKAATATRHCNPIASTIVGDRTVFANAGTRARSIMAACG